MKQWLFLFLATLSSCSLLQNNSFIAHANRLMGTHDFVYALPFEKGTTHVVAQGYRSLFSHAGDYAIDFKMRPGTKVLAARGGIVIRVKDNTKTGGLGKKYVGTANGIAIKHSDGTYGHYLHLKHKGALVAVGDTVLQGQHIAFSGSTGFSAFPHLHFEVTRQPQISKDDFPVLFKTRKGVNFLEPLHWYKAL